MSDDSTQNTGFTWSVSGGGSITQAGLYTAPSAAQSTAITITASKGGKSKTATITSIVAPPPTIVSRGPIAGKVGGSTTAFATMFTVTNSAASNYTFEVEPPEAGSVSAAGLLTLADAATGTVSVKATHSTVSSVTATCEFTGVTPKPNPPTILSKPNMTGKVGGDIIPFADMFTITDSTVSDYSFSVLPEGDSGSVDASTGALTLIDDVTDEMINVKATHKTLPDVTATFFVSATPKMMGLVLSQVTNTTVTGSPTLPEVTDTIMIINPDLAGVTRVDGVPQGAVTGDLMYDVEGADSSLMTVDLTSNVLTITLSAPITSEDTKITIRTNPGSEIFRTYLVKSGPKLKSIVRVDIQPKQVSMLTHGDTVQYTGVVHYSDDTTSNDVLFFCPLGKGVILGTGVYTAPAYDVAGPITIEARAADATTIRDSAIIEGVQAP